MANEIEKEYNELSKKYKLPRFRDLDSELEISSLDSANFLLRNSIRNAADKLECYSNLINSLLQPDTASLSGMHEMRFFDEDERNDTYNLFKRIMKCHRNAMLAVLENDEKSQADFLNNFFNEWVGIKKELIASIEKMKDSWDKETSIKEDLGYFG